MASVFTNGAKCDTDDSFCAAEQPESVSVSSSSLFEVIGGSLYRRKLEKGFVQYREVLAEDKRLLSIANFHEKRAGKLHHTLEDTYRLVAEHYWWEGMYFQVRDFVFDCEECQHSQSKRSACSGVGLISRMVESHSHQVLNKLNSQREAGLFCDITLKTGDGHSFVAHKAVLSAVSEYFQELFSEMDSATDPQSHVDLTGFSEQSILALLEFCYTSTLNLDLDILTEVCAMARHLRMWPALEVCSAIKRERESCQLGSINCSSCEPGKLVLKRKRDYDDGVGSSLSCYVQAQCRDHTVGEGTNESVGENGFPASPNCRMKLMDFKSPSCKKKPVVISPSSCTSTRSSSPSHRLLRSSPGAALALRRLLPKIDLSTKKKKKTSSYQVYKPHHFTVTPSQSQPFYQMSSVKVKQEDVEEEINKSIPQDEVHSPRAQEKYRLLGFLGLQRKSLVPDPAELSGWGQKKRLRKLKVSDYSLTARRKSHSQGSQLNFRRSLGVLVAVNPTLSLCDMSRMDLLNRPLKVEPQGSWTQERSKRKRQDPLQPVARTTRSRSLLQMDSSTIDRPIGRHNKNHNKAPSLPAQRGRRPPHNASSSSKGTMRGIKQESSDKAILQPIHRRNTVCSPKRTPPKGVGSRGRPPTDRTIKLASTKSHQTKEHKPVPAQNSKLKKSNHIARSARSNHTAGMLQGKQSRTERGAQVKENRKVVEAGNRKKSSELHYSFMNWGSANNQQPYNHPLYKTIKEEPADPLPLTQPFQISDPSDLGKRQSKPPVKLLDQGFLFGLCRQTSGIKREDESMDIYVTQSVSQGSSSNCTLTAERKDRIRARIMPDRTGLNGPHWAGLGNRHSPFSQRFGVRVKAERDEAIVSQDVPKRPQVKKKSCKVKKEPTKIQNVNKLLPQSSRHSILLETIHRSGLKKQNGPCEKASKGSHACLQCRAPYRDCDALIMHRIRHIQGKHWPCPLCSKTFFRQRNVRNHIRTHNPKLYKCRQCIAAQ